MPNSTPERIGEAIHGLLQRPNPVLFAGAGVGCRVGYPDWDEYIEHLAATCDRFGDPESAVLMRKRLEQKNHLGAATVFKSSNLIPEGERWKALAGPFKAKVTNSVLDKLMPLVGLPFSAIVTTNYEHSLHDAYAYKWRRWVPPVERGQLRSATLSREFFVARIHGSADQPTSMAIDTSDYRSLRAEDDYLDFVLNILRARSCLFLGFSFLDPAIAHVLDLYAERFGPTYDALHTAVVPEGDQSLASRLRGVNIQTIVYDPTDNHADLWRALRFTYDSAHIRSAEEGEVRVDVTYGHGPIHRFLAFTFAQA